MARTRSPPSNPPDLTSINLTRLLSRLEQTLLSSDSSLHSKSLRKSSYERTRVGANLEYARSLLLRLEHDSPRGKAHAPRRQDLQDKRALLRKLQARLKELGRANEDSSEDDDSDAEDILATYAPTRPDASSSLEVFASEASSSGGRPSGAQQAAAAATVVSSLRARGKAQDARVDTGSTTGSSAVLPTGRQPNSTTTSPFAPKASSSDAKDSTSTTKLLESHETEQTALTDSLLTLASALKASTMSFSDSVTASNPLVDQTVQALDKNVGGMEQAGQRMGSLRKMTEGKGWWARLGLWARVGVLWVVLVLVMFVMPKLRF